MALSDENNRISKISPSSNGRKTGFEPVNIRSSRIGEAKKSNYRDIKLFKNVSKENTGCIPRRTIVQINFLSIEMICTVSIVVNNVKTLIH